MKFISFLASCCIVGSSLVTTGQQFTFVKYGTAEGLRHSQVYDVAQDENNNLWLATATSFIYRFDGSRFHPYKISVESFSGSIYSYRIRVDRFSRIWVLSNIGIILFNGKKWTLVSSARNLVLGFDAKWIIDKKDRLWIVDDTGEIFLKNGDVINKFPLSWPGGPRKVSDLFENEKGELIFVTAGGVVANVKDIHSIEFSKWPWLANQDVTAIENTSSEIIAGSAESITIFSKKSGKSFIVPLEKELVNKKINRIFRDKHGLLWVLAQGYLICIDLTHRAFIVNKDNGFINNAVFSIFKDNNGVAWFCTDAEGIFTHRQQPLKKLSLGKSTHVLSTAFGCDSSIVMGTYDQGVIQEGRNLLKGKMVTCLLSVSPHEFYAGTMGDGLYRIRGTRVDKIPLTLEKTDYIFCINQLDQKIIFGSLLGLHVLENGKTKSFNHNSASLIVNTITPTDSLILVGTEALGLMKFNFKTFEPIGPDFLKESTVYAIREDKSGNFLVGGDFPQILIFDHHLKLTSTLDVSSSVSNILFIEIIDESNLLVGSNDGVFTISHQRGVVKSIRRFGKTEGYEGEEVYLNSSMRLTKNSIMFGTTGGAYLMEKENDQALASIPRTYITEVLLFNHTTDWGMRGDSLNGYFRIPYQPSLQHNENNVTFIFSGTSLGNPENINFQYQLLGLEKNWSAMGNTKQVTYSNLSPGNYVFKVQSVGDDRVFGNISSCSVTVLPAFWQTNGFYLLLLALFVLIIFLIIRFSVRFKLQQLQVAEEMRIGESMKIRKQMSMDFHDEMGNKLASMLAQASMLKLKNVEGELNHVFDYFERTAYSIYQGTRDFIWSIDFKSNNLREVVSYLCDFAFTYFEKNSVALNIDEHIQSDDFDGNLSEGHNRQIVLIFKEAMTNAVKHSMCKGAHLRANLQGNMCTLIFSDDGVWKETRSPGNGLKNMYERANKIGAILRIKREGQTEVSLSFNINKVKDEKKLLR